MPCMLCDSKYGVGGQIPQRGKVRFLLWKNVWPERLSNLTNEPTFINSFLCACIYLFYSFIYVTTGFACVRIVSSIQCLQQSLNPLSINLVDAALNS